MRFALAVAVALLALSSPRPAHADECAGVAASSVECNALDKPGTWSLSVGWDTVPFNPVGRTFKVTDVGFVNQIGQVDGSALAAIHGDGFYINVRFHMSPRWYFGVEPGVAWAGAPQPRFLADGATVNWDSAAIMTLVGVVGVRVPLGRFALRAELLGGLRAAELGATTPPSQSVRADAIEPLVEPRLALDLWAGDHCVFEAFAGVNALDRTEQTFGLGLGFHAQAFDGRY